MRIAHLTRTSFRLLAAGVLLAACHRETRELHSSPPSHARSNPVRLSTLVPGPTPPPVGEPSNEYDQYAGNAYAISEGQRLYHWYHCSGCHSNGGGGIGPALMDSVWTYGGSPNQIHASIVQGRPNGMPSWGGRIPDDQIWEIVAYVRSLSGLEPQSATPSRSDHLPTRPDRR